jgi:hypothetical protein
MRIKLIFNKLELVLQANVNDAKHTSKLLPIIGTKQQPLCFFAKYLPNTNIVALFW